MLNKTTLKQWFLVISFDAPKPVNRILWGIVDDDPSMRWLLGDYCCTSPMLKLTANDMFITKNSKYTNVGPGQIITLPVKALIELRAEHARDDYLPMQALLHQSYPRDSDSDK